ncbi:Long-chain-fatty-acid--CoA ligase [Entamoeba marina]
MSTTTFSKKHLEKKDGYYYIHCKEEEWHLDSSLPKEHFLTNTAYELFKKRVEKYPNENVFGYRQKLGEKFGEYQWLDGLVSLELIDSMASGIVGKLKLNKGDMCGIMTVNRYEWFIVQFAMQRQGIIPIPLYTTLGEQGLNYIIQQLHLKYLFCGSPVTKGLELIEMNPTMGLITFDDYSNIPIDIKHYNYNELLNYGRQHLIEPDLPSLNDTFSVIFTSGTSGKPKGVVHTHHSVNNAIYSFTTAGAVDAKDILLHKVYYSYLPSAHVFDQQITLTFIYGYGSVGFNSGKISMIVDDFKALKPTFLIAVPRVLQKIYNTFIETVQSSCLINTFYKVAYHYKRNAVINKSWNYINWDTLLFNRVKNMMGGRLEFILNGSAPLTPELYEWLRVATGANIIQGYGMTESFGGFSTMLPGLHDDNLTSVGSSCTDVIMRLASVPDMNYTIDNEIPSGEIQVKAEQLYKEYFNDEKQTKESFTEDGYFCTGDIGIVNYDGSLSIIDRKKNLFKLAQGEYIAVEPLEYIYSLSDYVSQCFVYGESTDTFIIAIIVPELVHFKKYLKETFNFEGSNDELKQFVKSKHVLDTFRKELEKHVRSKKVAGYEVVKNIYIELEPFNEANELATPSFKLRRIKIKEKYEGILTKMRQEVLNEF